MPLSPRKHEKLNNNKLATVSLDSFLGLLSSAYGTEELDSSIIFDKDTVNWKNISVENLKAIPKKDDKVKKEKSKEFVKVNAATSTTNLRSNAQDEDGIDETLFSIRSLTNLKSKIEGSVHDISADIVSEECKDNPEEITDPKETEMEDTNASGDDVEAPDSEGKTCTPICGFYVDDSNKQVVFDIQFFKKVPSYSDMLMPVFDVGEPEICISVTDITKQMKANMKVAKCNLVAKVQYFAEIEKEFGLENLEVVVKCNFGVFQWVLQWIKSDIPMCKPNLNVSNLKSILSMAYHLGVDQLVQECVDYFCKNFNTVLDSDREIEDVFDEKLLLDLTIRFSNSEVDKISDKYDNLKTKMFCTLIKLLTDPKPCLKVGHFSTLAMTFQCGLCEKFMNTDLKDLIPCRTDCNQINIKGQLEFHHEYSSSWNLSKYVEAMFEELQSWRLVYWKLWGMCHFFYCEVCQIWYPLCQTDWCTYHPAEVEYFPMANNMFYPIGSFGCCGEKTFRFSSLKQYGGCKFKSHITKLDTIEKVEQFNIYQDYKNFINYPAPEEIKAKKFIKLVKKSDESFLARNDLLNERFWWEGILLAPKEKDDYSLIPLHVLNRLRNRPQEKKPQKPHNSMRYGPQVPFGNMPQLEENSLEKDSKAGSSSEITLPQLSKKNRPKLVVRKGKSSSIISGMKSRTKKKKSLSFVYQPTDSIWNHLESNKDNQDNQRDFEEIAMRKLVKMLTPADSSVSPVESSAGSYIRLETDWWQRNCGPNMDKTSSTVVNRTFPLSWFRKLTI